MKSRRCAPAGSQETPCWRKADSNPRSRSYEWGCLVSPNRNDQLGARIKLRSSRETAIAAGPLGGRSVHGGTEGSNPLSSSKESANFRSLSGGRIGVREARQRRGRVGSNPVPSCGESANSRSRCSAHCSLSNLLTSVKPVKNGIGRPSVPRRRPASTCCRFAFAPTFP
jgi:hypothetical protein